VAGIGCGKGATAEEVLAAVAAAAAGRAVDALATVPEKRHEPGIAEAARRLGVPLLVADGRAVDPTRLATRSPASQAATGTGSAAEAAALAVAGPDARLVAARCVIGPVTCSIAESAP